MADCFVLLLDAMSCATTEAVATIAVCSRRCESRGRSDAFTLFRYASRKGFIFASYSSIRAPDSISCACVRSRSISRARSNSRRRW